MLTRQDYLGRLNELLQMSQSDLAHVPSQEIDQLLSWLSVDFGQVDIAESSDSYITKMLAVGCFLHYEWERYEDGFANQAEAKSEIAHGQFSHQALETAEGF